MNSRIRTLAVSLLVAALVLTAGLVAPALAQTSDDEAEPETVSPAEPESGETQATSEEALTRRERKQQAKEQRIQEYLRKREERRARKEMDRESRQASHREKQAREIEREQIAAAEGAARSRAAKPTPAPPRVEPVAPTEKTAKSRRRDRARSGSGLPRGLARAQANVRATELGRDPTVQEYLGLIDQQGASPHQLAAFGSFIAQNGLVRDALEYYEVALRLAGDDPVLWVNVGTLQMQTRNLSAAASSFSRALSIDPNHAVAHYNLGAALDEMNRYEDAVAEYKTALTLDPALGDPTVNPQAANNNLLLAVKLMLYQEQAGSLGVPLLDVTTGKLPGAEDRAGEQ